MDFQGRRVYQVSKDSLEDQDPRVTLDIQGYLDCQVMPKFEKQCHGIAQKRYETGEGS